MGNKSPFEESRGFSSLESAGTRISEFRISSSSSSEKTKSSEDSKTNSSSESNSNDSSGSNSNNFDELTDYEEDSSSDENFVILKNYFHSPAFLALTSVIFKQLVQCISAEPDQTAEKTSKFWRRKEISQDFR